MTAVRKFRLGAVAGVAALLLFAAARVPANAQVQKIVPCPAAQQSLITMPEISSHNTGKLKATLRLVDAVRTMWDSTSTPRCATQYLRVFEGTDALYPKPWPTGSEPIPGPTFRAKLGDLVEITFFNEVNPRNFAASLDHSDMGSTAACDKYIKSSSGTNSAPKYGFSGPGNDVMPNCLHGSSTTNVHYHGTHTTPSTTGDNVLLFVRPALGKKPNLQPSEAQTNAMLASFFTKCQTSGPPKYWNEMPPLWRALQRNLTLQYDNTTSLAGQPPPLPPHNQITPVNDHEISLGLWPQYHIGAVPYCFPLPKYDPAKMRMGQAPGTHWYHAHKHGSTALNVANGMTGAFIIEGKYDDDLKAYYGAGLREQVLMIQQLSTAPFTLIGGGTPPISVNGRRNPVVAMQPGEVQMWRIMNGAWRDAIDFVYFQTSGANQCSTAAPPATPPVQWRQIAQDGVQFNVVNYQRIGTVNNPFNLAPANRADILVKAPAATGSYTLCVVRNVTLLPTPPSPTALLSVKVAGTPVSPAKDFIPNAKFPTFPSFLADITPSEIHKWRELVFGPGHSTIDGKPFADGVVNQQMTLNTAEEWTVKNEANDKAHPFHIHINPFQVIEVFEPNAPEATTPGNPCFVDPTNPATFKPCPAIQPKVAPGPPWWIWWDTFPIPTGQQVSLTCTKLADCPAPVRPYTRCASGSCTEFIPGWFKMRSRFVDFTGQYVLHCHILIHEDRGMMQLVEVISDKTPYTHH